MPADQEGAWRNRDRTASFRPAELNNDRAGVIQARRIPVKGHADVYQIL